MIWRPGGHYNVTHIDLGSLLWLQSLGVKSVTDVGAGPGGQVRLARSLGMQASGIDADPTVCDSDCVWYGKVGKHVPELPADAVWTIETAEHIEPEHADAYVETITSLAKRYICLTSNHRPGSHHVNPQPTEYWIERVAQRKGWNHSPELTEAWKAASTMTRDFVRESGAVFERVLSG